MGLDMYLRGKKYVSGYKFNENAETEQYDKVIEAVGAGELKSIHSPGAEVIVTMMYWRKANAIHQWFVTHVQDGEDECRPHYVSRDNLIQLKHACAAVLADKDLAMGLLPPQAGFFFGGTELDDWYWGSVQETYDEISRLLNNTSDDDWSFEYQSSW